MHPGKRVMLLWDSAGQDCRGRVDNSLEDGSLSFRVSSRNLAQQEVGFCNEVHDIFRNDRDVVDAWRFGEKLISFIFQLNVHLDYFTIWRASQPPQPHRGGQLRVSQKISTVSGELTQFLVLIVMNGVQLRLRQGGLVSLSEKWREYSKLRIH